MEALSARQTKDLSPMERAEEALVALIRERLGEDFFVDHFPEKPAAFDAASRPRLVLVQYMGSRYGEPEGGRNAVQKRRAEFAIHLQLASAGAPVRALAHMEKLRLAIQGQRVAGARVQLLRDALADHDENNGSWKFILEAALELPAVAMPPNQITPALMAGTTRGT